MADIKKNAVLSELLTEHSELIPVVNRFGIKLGVGEKTIEKICLENDLNIDFILAILNVYLDEEYNPEKDLDAFDVSLIVDYLKRTVENYMQASVPNLEKHFTPFIAMSGGENEELKLLHKIFYQFKSELSEHLQQGLEQLSDYPNELLHDLKNIIIRHISGNFNQNLAYAVIFSITALEKELHIHNRLLEKVLRPKLKELDSGHIEHLNHTFSDEHKLQEENKQLTNREIEVLKLIVQGRLNKEIADKLNISLNTVLSHRKNIIAKTGIKTVSGLTFYSISNGYVSPGDHVV
ncbi:MAG: LuxR C-terminal-related transcriptional regulator [Petrimonas sp.]|jgi:DNA-binding CsgD family transcriptional regulator|uniref:HTH luxR-type domain-containing protein n=1 Tax=bioreactor metagenome TaxID=1076179 RepID=A0A644Y823_9ZZZZ|nr:LuxR C-terminal-related transcriptional regulator [Petrimonas sp.]NLU29878.1 LuxR family transcriptional regulator [Bacteroidales bacterium]HAC74328.1 LuxR family transcriptional regulator [Porphyromonadaceae bacterium]MDD2910335.1 LuxR C-terminal-related transcriptional regulator [Petrimonas sp.]MDD3541416.1 LuxR C-terminal-related transcriptional regulator [Petrimonas sp.]